MPSAFAQEKSTWYEPSAINFHLGETAPQERKGRGRRHADRTVGLRGSVAAAVFALERGPPGTLRRIYRSRRDMRHWRAREIILARDAVIARARRWQCRDIPFWSPRRPRRWRCRRRSDSKTRPPTSPIVR